MPIIRPNGLQSNKKSHATTHVAFHDHADQSRKPPLSRRPQAVAAKAEKTVGTTQPRASTRGYPQTAPSARIATHTNNNDSIFRSAKLISPQTRSQSHHRMNLQISEANCQMLKLLDPKGKADQFSSPTPSKSLIKNALERGRGEAIKKAASRPKTPPAQQSRNPRFGADRKRSPPKRKKW